MPIVESKRLRGVTIMLTGEQRDALIKHAEDNQWYRVPDDPESGPNISTAARHLINVNLINVNLINNKSK